MSENWNNVEIQKEVYTLYTTTKQEHYLSHIVETCTATAAYTVPREELKTVPRLNLKRNKNISTNYRNGNIYMYSHLDDHNVPIHPAQQDLGGGYCGVAPRLPDVSQDDRVGQQHHEVEQVEEGEEGPHHAGRHAAPDLHVGVVAHLAVGPAPVRPSGRLPDRVDHGARQDHAHPRHPHPGAHPAGGVPPGGAGEEARRQQPGAQAGPGRVRVLHQGGEAAERHPGEDEDGDKDVDVEHRGDKVQHQLTQEVAQRPHWAQREVGGQEGRGQRQQHVGNAEVGQAEVDGRGGGGGDAAEEDPQRQGVAQQPGEGEEGVDAGQDIGGDGGGAEEERGRGRVGQRGELHHICLSTAARSLF